MAVLHTYALRQWVRSVCRSQKKLRNTAETYLAWDDKTYNLVVVLGLKLVVVIAAAAAAAVVVVVVVVATVVVATVVVTTVVQ